MPRAKQSELPAVEGLGVSPVRIKAIDVAADKYLDARDTRMDQTIKECEARDVLIEKMGEHGLTSYRYGDHEVAIKDGKVGVKVKNIDGTEDGNSEEAGD